MLDFSARPDSVLPFVFILAAQLGFGGQCGGLGINS